MRRSFTTAILIPAILLASPGFMFSQEPPADHSQAQAAAHAPGSPEETLAQLSYKIAAIYREMAGLASDPNRMSELKSRYARLAEEEENAARAMQSMAAYHQTIAGASRQSSQASSTKRPNYGDSAFRR